MNTKTPQDPQNADALATGSAEPTKTDKPLPLIQQQQKPVSAERLFQLRQQQQQL